jgi:hypothetical protein
MDRASLRAAIGAGRGRLEAALAEYDDAAMLERVDGEWTRKDVLAHLEAWERRLIALAATLRAGDPPPPNVETDALNEQFFQASRHRSVDDVRTRERDAYQQMLAVIDEAADEELFDGGHYRWTDGEPFASWFRENGDEHFDEHLEQLTRPALGKTTG